MTNCFTELISDEVEVSLASKSVDDKPDHLVKSNPAFHNRARKVEVRHTLNEKAIDCPIKTKRLSTLYLVLILVSFFKTPCTE
jgi:hypothetical protein